MKRVLQLLAFCITAVLSIACQPSNNNGSYRSTDAVAFKKLVDAHQAVIIDVRHADEFAEDHLEGALNIDVEEPGFASNIGSLDKSKSYLVYCRAGRRSMKAASEMVEAGFKDVVNLEGGITSWKDNGFPVSK